MFLPLNNITLQKMRSCGTMSATKKYRQVESILRATTLDTAHGFGICEVLLIFILLVNLLTFVLFALDKRSAIKNKWRISERTLILFTLCGGGIGAYFGMYVLRHKTQKLKFKLASAVGLIICVAALIYIIFAGCLHGIFCNC